MPIRAEPSILCTREWLATHLGAPGLRIFDCSAEMLPQPVGRSRLVSGRSDWEREHVPGARYLSMFHELSAPQGTVPYGLPAMEHVTHAMRAHGVNDGDTIVLYGSGYLGPVVRTWWVLTASGAHDVRVLDGGLEGWREAGLPLTADAGPEPVPGTFTARLRPSLRADAQEVAATMNDPRGALVNALSPEQFSGRGGAHYGRPGRIPGSVSVPFRDLLRRGTSWFRSAEEIRCIFASAGVLERPRIISYCGGGIAASGITFALHLIGRSDAALYDGSLTDWSADPSRPMVTGEA
ncbi:sulfurtransferase [Xanthobacter aminoxidans]|uniref:sulfurtransferase n=1 Tax=Xanthobacter aminoxidans TaxID=186280 RepID=UPI002022BB0E|nr:sulfurtransferase [Xanthobacter aminoxidans]MCL8385431.1 sulfurtransferase [Xanthobacter aminoxidans]